MDEERQLYPFRLCTIEDKYAWGSEEFKLADLGYRDTLIRDGFLAGNSISEVMDMYMDAVVGEKVFGWLGRQFPLQLKYLRIDGRYPFMVHPSDEVASQRYDLLGKQKCWRVLEASEDARLYLGFREDTDAAALCDACAAGTLTELMNVVKPVPGDMFDIAPGTVHGASGHLVILEVSESSALDFLVWHWGDVADPGQFEESLDLVSALDFIDYRKYTQPSDRVFSVDVLHLDEPLDFSSDRFDAFTLFSCLRGSAAVRDLGQEGGEAHVFHAGEAVLVPADCTSYTLVPAAADTIVLEIHAIVPDFSELPMK